MSWSLLLPSARDCHQVYIYVYIEYLIICIFVDVLGCICSFNLDF